MASCCLHVLYTINSPKTVHLLFAYQGPQWFKLTVISAFNDKWKRELLCSRYTIIGMSTLSFGSCQSFLIRCLCKNEDLREYYLCNFISFRQIKHKAALLLLHHEQMNNGELLLLEHRSDTPKHSAKTSHSHTNGHCCHAMRWPHHLEHFRVKCHAQGHNQRVNGIRTINHWTFVTGKPDLRSHIHSKDKDTWKKIGTDGYSLAESGGNWWSQTGSQKNIRWKKLLINRHDECSNRHQGLCFCL